MFFENHRFARSLGYSLMFIGNKRLAFPSYDMSLSGPALNFCHQNGKKKITSFKFKNNVNKVPPSGLDILDRAELCLAGNFVVEWYRSIIYWRSSPKSQ